MTSASLVGKPIRAARLNSALLTSYLGEMPIAPAVLPRLQSLLLNDSFEAGEVLELVRIDPGLAARLIHAAGTAACARGEPVRSLDEALFRLGAHEAYRLTATIAMSQFLNTALEVYGVDPRTFWRESVACALAMVDLAPAGGLDERTAYTVGLLHAMGMVFIDRHLRCVGAPHLRFGPMPPDEIPKAEVMLTGMHNARAAAHVLRAWGFGEEIAEPIEHQLRPGGALRHRAMASLLAEARTMAIELAPKLPAPEQGFADPQPRTANDAWRASITERVLLLEGDPV